VLSTGCTASPDLEPVKNKTELHFTDTTSEQAVNAPTSEVLHSTAELPVSTPAHLDLAESYIGTTELTGNNDGLEVEQFLGSVGLKKGNPYCAAFISFILDETPGIKSPTIRTALASKFITNTSIDAKQVLRGTEAIPDGSIVIWQKGNTIFGHAGFVESQLSSNRFRTIEANTRSGTYGDQSDGDGVWRRQRSILPGNYFRITKFTFVRYEQRA
jgi:hypothetical protein